MCRTRITCPATLPAGTKSVVVKWDGLRKNRNWRYHATASRYHARLETLSSRVLRPARWIPLRRTKQQANRRGMNVESCHRPSRMNQASFKRIVAWAGPDLLHPAPRAATVRVRGDPLLKSLGLAFEHQSLLRELGWGVPSPPHVCE